MKLNIPVPAVLRVRWRSGVAAAGMLGLAAIAGAMYTRAGAHRKAMRSRATPERVIDVDWMSPYVDVLEISNGGGASLYGSYDVHMGEGRFVIHCSRMSCADRTVRVVRGNASVTDGRTTVNYGPGDVIEAPLRGWEAMAQRALR